MTDDELVTAFENGALESASFHHVDHVRVGFLLMVRHPAWEALRRFSDSIRALAAASGHAGRYHETITWAFLLLIQERIARWEQAHGDTPTWPEFATSNADLLNWTDHVLQTYYRDETLASEIARRTFVMPDRG